MLRSRGTSRSATASPGLQPTCAGGASNVAIHRPGGVAAQLRVVGGSTNLAFDERRFGAVGGEVSLQSPDYEGASDRYDITITGGASSVIIDAR
jgi:hypothetical protein